MDRKRIAVLTGAGISAESGLQTFRDAGGLWNGYAIEQVATPEAWEQDPQRVLDFYNMRRREAAKAIPNAAHFALAALDECHDVSIITQNVDDLHERAGSRNILHLHGEIMLARSTRDPRLIRHLGDADVNLGDRCELGSQLRPHIVWFGEMVPAMEEAVDLVGGADVLLVVGTSLQVYPAAGLVFEAPKRTRRIVVNPDIPERVSGPAFEIVSKSASIGVPEVVADLMAATVRAHPPGDSTP